MCRCLWENCESFRPERRFINQNYSYFRCVCACAHWGLSLARHQSTIDVDSGDVCGGPLLAPPSTSTRVQSRFEFVKLVVVKMYSNYHRCHWDYIRVHMVYRYQSLTCKIRMYQRFTCRIRTNIWMRTYPLWHTYVWRSCDFDLYPVFFLWDLCCLLGFGFVWDSFSIW